MEKINFVNGQAPALSAENLKLLQDNIEQAIEIIHPVGSIFQTIDPTNPSEYFGGTWEEIARGRTLVGVDPNDSDFNTVLKTGGSKYLQKHTHMTGININYVGGLAHPGADTCGVSQAKDKSQTAEAGSGNSGNLQPYITCYIWCRTA